MSLGVDCLISGETLIGSIDSVVETGSELDPCKKIVVAVLIELADVSVVVFANEVLTVEGESGVRAIVDDVSSVVVSIGLIS